ncbi:MAG: response regulator transcription factor [Bacillota bacterium]
MTKILVVEDDTSLAQGISYALENENFVVLLAVNLKEARNIFENDKFALILLDVMLPDGNGFDFCKEIRKKSNIPLIFLTACDEEVNIVQGLELGGDDYITKPFRVRELISRINTNLRRVQNQSEKSKINSGDLTFYPSEQKLMKNGEELFLTPVENKLLTIFINNPLQVLSRNQILEKIWDINGDFIENNTLSVNIRRLREKIENDPSNPDYISTIRGRGYKWNQRSQ